MQIYHKEGIRVRVLVKCGVCFLNGGLRKDILKCCLEGFKGKKS